ncbi:MAG TPA: ATP-binding protein [Amaricoccus sp.]|nr:ATP-binding protein [Amaricoccus sp.]
MAKWLPFGLAVAVGALVALASVLALPPLLAFGAGVLVSLLGAAALTQPPPAPAPPQPGLASATMPSAFGRALIEKLPTPLLVISRTGRVSYANPAALDALPRLEPGAHFAHLIRAPVFVEAVTATLSDGQERRVRFATHQDQERFLEARVGLLPPGDAFGPEALGIVQIEDRTEQRRTEQLRSDFIAHASHEIRTPLASIIGYIETLQNHARDDPEARERFLGIMAREAGRMRRLVDDLMSLSRIEMSEHVRPVEEWSLTRIAAESAAALLPLAEQLGVTLEVDLGDGEAARVQGDRDQLEQVFTNLIDNAMKYGGPGAAVRVTAAGPGRPSPNRVGITVSDNGPGIPREHIHRLTERFYRVSAASSRNKGGTGLGLAIVKHILNRHGGRLEITSEPGRGSAFTAWLPRSDATAEPAGEGEEGGNLRSA